MSKDTALWVASTRDPDGEPVCELTWGPVQWYAPVADVRQTALDLVSCAAYADMIKLLIAKVGLEPAVVEQVTLDLMRVAGRTRDHGTPSTIDVFPASGTSKARGREAVVIFRRGGIDGMVTSVEAREMAQQWMAVAEATESDQLVAEAFRATFPGNGGLDRLFGYLRKLRDRA